MAQQRRKSRPISDEERAEIFRMAEDGTPYRAIAERFDRPQGTINRAISDGILAGKVTRRRDREDPRKD
jgi:DNA-directed RNA polymerase specialized sigma24 family protein